MDPRVPYGFFHERERGPDGRMRDVATVLLTNRECPWTCRMCDLWVNTTDVTVPAGAIAAQLDHALARLPRADVIKLYNAGSFFDAQAIPRAAWPEVIARVRGFERVIVEAHPALVGPPAADLSRELDGKLEVAMGLETAHPEVLAGLNKGMTLDDFRAAAERLADAGIPLRAFVMVRPPGMAAEECVEWAVESVRFARDCGAGCAVLIPTRGPAPPSFASFARAVEEGLAVARPMRLFADTWDAARLTGCADCLAWLRGVNDTQAIPANRCGHGPSDR